MPASVTGPMSISTNNQFEDQALPRNTVHEVVPTPMYAVKYTDGYGETKMRLVIMIGEQPFLLPALVSDKANASQKWFADQLRAKLSPVPAKIKKARKRKAKRVEPEEPPIKPINPDAM